METNEQQLNEQHLREFDEYPKRWECSRLDINYVECAWCGSAFCADCLGENKDDLGQLICSECAMECEMEARAK